MAKEITIEQFNKLKPAQVKNGRNDNWRNGYRLIRINRKWTTVAFIYNNTVLQVHYYNDLVRLIN